MALVSPTQVELNGAITSASVNTPINQLAAVINGGIDSNNLADGAVSTAKLVDDAVTSAKLAAGAVVQVVNTSSSAVATGTALIPLDDTIPQNTEGTEFMTLAITPKSATNKLVIEVTVSAATSAANNLITALFKGTTANAIAVTSQAAPNINQMYNTTLRHELVAGTTSATTFKVRVGGNGAATFTFNGISGSRYFGAITKSSMTITEYKA